MGTFGPRRGPGLTGAMRWKPRGTFHRPRAAFGHGRFGRRFGYAGAFFGLPLGYGWGPWGAAAAPVHAEPQTVKLEWPTAVGIPPSPVAPPALYVIGGDRRGKASAAPRRLRSAKLTHGNRVATGKLASGPVFIRVPSGR